MLIEGTNQSRPPTKTPTASPIQPTRMARRFMSATVVTELARDAARTPPPTDDAQTYFDQSLVILGRTFEVQRREMQSQLQTHNGSILDHINGLRRDVDQRFQEVEAKMDQRFREVEAKMDQRFREVEAKMDERFQDVDKRFQDVDKRFQEVEAKMDAGFKRVEVMLENERAIRTNSTLRRMHQPINLVKVLKPTGPDTVQWQSHPRFPKHMKGLYRLGQLAKDEANDRTPYRRQQQEALRTIRELAAFYEVVVYSDEQSESEGTEVDVQADVDAYMEILLDKWGMDWTKVCEIAQRTLMLQQGHAGTKRPGNPIV
ncbi:conserved hypothetical protein [Histoplasma capsulatum var. duboisii H88]|uniref:Uncharacterized protein n=1 Tax=Ajellomyces capsulatus (strain H88) TaxID=544711 RepID=F0ULL4_AJEC8|nr:conserved hypothetical protein [Histoplasma capsulatum var. duboisii H88]QSS53343.1 hypothetical protein I7I53_00573 [Histoplasma capsulatum var. duboisii H88]